MRLHYRINTCCAGYDNEASSRKHKKNAVSLPTKQPFLMVNGKVLSKPVHAFDQFFILPDAPGSQDITPQHGKMKDAP